MLVKGAPGSKRSPWTEERFLHIIPFQISSNFYHHIKVTLVGDKCMVMGWRRICNQNFTFYHYIYFYDVFTCTITSWHGNTFHIAGPLWGESTRHSWIPSQGASNVKLIFFAFFAGVGPWTNSRVASDFRWLMWCSMLIWNVTFEKHTWYRWKS